MQNETANEAVGVVQSFLDACGAAEFERAYAMLATSIQTDIPLTRFSAGMQMPPIPPEEEMPLALVAISALIVDSARTIGFRYRVVGPSTSLEDVVDIEVEPPASTERAPFLIHLVLERETERGLLIDMYASMERTDPEGVVRTKALAAERTEQSRQRHEQLMAERAQQGQVKPLPD